MENFRQKWKQDLSKSNKNASLEKENSFDNGNFLTFEEKARNIFLEGVEHEENGELFEAIQKYRKAINMVPDIEYKVHEHNTRRRASEIPKPAPDCENLPNIVKFNF